MTIANEHERLAAEGMYPPEFGSNACGVGIIAGAMPGHLITKDSEERVAA
ncbi:MAG: hypothetical protein V2J26_01405 [Pacificimonas sp.]|jgi:hypothetical protein|nr:hypothetical protein [Pacificimonas sp.]